MGGKYTTARFSVEGESFEILVNPDAALDFREGRPIEISQVLVMDIIFSDASKGIRSSEEKLQKFFQNSDPYKIAEVILRRGQLQLTTEQRRKLVEDMRKQIVTFISRRCIDPRTGLPHPPLRIEQAMAQIHMTIDPFKTMDEQAKAVIEELRPILPIRIEEMRIAVKVPPEYAPQSIGVAKNFGLIKQQEWQVDGSWIAILEIPAGLHVSFLEKLGKVTQGTSQMKILK